MERPVASSGVPSISAVHVVAVTVRGVPRADGRLPDDRGLIAALLRWLLDERIFPLIPGGWSGGGSYRGFYSPADAERVIEWCKSHGATVVAWDEQP